MTTNNAGFKPKIALGYQGPRRRGRPVIGALELELQQLLTEIPEGYGRQLDGQCGNTHTGTYCQREQQIAASIRCLGRTRVNYAPVLWHQDAALWVGHPVSELVQTAATVVEGPRRRDSLPERIPETIAPPVIKRPEPIHSHDWYQVIKPWQEGDHTLWRCIGCPETKQIQQPQEEVWFGGGKGNAHKPKTAVKNTARVTA